VNAKFVRIEVLVLKGFFVLKGVVVYVWFMIKEWGDILLYRDNRRLIRYFYNQEHRFS
jgi:hypothetical protein